MSQMTTRHQALKRKNSSQDQEEEEEEESNIPVAPKAKLRKMDPALLTILQRLETKLDGCTGQLDNTNKKLDNTNQKLDNIEINLSSLKDEVTEVKADLADVRTEVKEVSKSHKDLKNEVAELQSKMLKEMATQEERKSQLVAFKVPETEGETDRDHDKTEVLKLLCLATMVDRSEIVFMRRQGPKIPNKTRPIIVGLKSIAKTDEILSSRTKMNIGPNLTKVQQTERKRLVAEAQSKNGAEGHQLYKVVGRPNQYRIIKKSQERMD
jgi:chromosome segregation ATPase